jgi:hypothetical protein
MAFCSMELSYLRIVSGTRSWDPPVCFCAVRFSFFCCSLLLSLNKSFPSGRYRKPSHYEVL